MLQNSKFCNTFFVVIKLKYVTYPVILRYIFAFSHKFALRGSCWHHYKCASRLVRVIQHCRVCASQEGIGIALLDLPCSFDRYIQREVTWRLYNRAVATAPLPTFAASPQKFPQTPGASLNSVRLRGTFPLGLPEYIRQTALSCVRGPHLRFAAFRRMSCWRASLCCKTLNSFATPPFFSTLCSLT